MSTSVTGDGCDTVPIPYVTGARNVPFPFPRNISSWLSITDRSSSPSPFTSPSVTDDVWAPATSNVVGAWNVPFPFPSNTLPAFPVTARSSRPSPFRSPSDTDDDCVPPIANVVGAWSVPFPFPSKTLTAAVPVATTTSGLRSPLTSPKARESPLPPVENVACG